MISIDHLRKILPQTYPFLMIDRIADYKENESLTAIKNITAGEWFYQQGPRDNTVFPEVFMIEAAAQAAIILYHLITKSETGTVLYLGRIKAEFYRPVYVGEQLRIFCRAGKVLKQGGVADAVLSVDEKQAAAVTVIYGIHQ